MNSQNTPYLDPAHLFDLYFRHHYDQLSEQFLNILKYFRSHTYLELDDQSFYFINIFVKNFLYLFSQPDYILSDQYVRRFIQKNAVISNLVAISSFRNTDTYLTILKYQSRNFAKLLTLYSARNTVRIDRKSIFNSDQKLACLWYSHFFEIYPAGLANPLVYANLKEQLKYEDERLTDFYVLEDVYLGSTYIDPILDRQIKQKMNQSIKIWLSQTAPPITQEPRLNKIAIITGKWFSQHVVYRTMSQFVQSLAEDYELTLIHLGDVTTELAIHDFANIKYVQFKQGQLNWTEIQDNQFMAVYYPDIGMNPESILLSNLRLAPIQIASVGHPISTWGSEIDYFMSGAGVELPEKAEENYSERLVLVPGLGVVYNPIEYELQHLPKDDARLIINCSWSAQKVNYPLIC